MKKVIYQAKILNGGALRAASVYARNAACKINERVKSKHEIQV